MNEQYRAGDNLTPESHIPLEEGETMTIGELIQLVRNGVTWARMGTMQGSGHIDDLTFKEYYCGAEHEPDGYIEYSSMLTHVDIASAEMLSVLSPNVTFAQGSSCVIKGLKGVDMQTTTPLEPQQIEEPVQIAKGCLASWRKSWGREVFTTQPTHLPNTMTFNTEGGKPIKIQYRKSIPGVEDSINRPVVILTGRLSNGYEETYNGGNLSTSPLTEFAIIEFDDIFQAQQFTLACRALRDLGRTRVGTRYPVANIIRYALTSPEVADDGFSIQKLSNAEVVKEPVPHTYKPRKPLSLADLPSD